MKQVLKLILKMGLASVPIMAVWAYLYFCPMSYFDGEAPYYLWNRDFSREAHEEKYDLVIIGDSAANAAFEPEYMSEGAVNLSLGGSSPAEEYYVLKEFIEANGAPRTVYMYYNAEHMSAPTAFWERSVYSHRFNFDEVMTMIADAEAHSCDFITAQPHYRNLAVEYLYSAPEKYLPALLNAGFNGRLSDNRINYNHIDIHRGTYISRKAETGDLYQPEVYYNFPVGDFSDYYLKKTIELCSENDITVRIIDIPPATGAKLETLQYSAEKNTYFFDIANSYDNVTYLTGIEGMNRYDYSDAIHMNTRGALKFSKLMKTLYPEDFYGHEDEDFSEKTLYGINDYLEIETQPDQLVERIQGTGYKVLFVSYKPISEVEAEYRFPFTEGYGAVCEDKYMYADGSGSSGTIAAGTAGEYSCDAYCGESEMHLMTNDSGLMSVCGSDPSKSFAFWGEWWANELYAVILDENDDLVMIKTFTPELSVYETERKD